MMAVRRLYARALADQRNSAELIDNLQEGIYRSSLDGRQLSANRSLVRLNGYENEAEMLAAVNDIAREWYVDPARRDEFGDILKRRGRVEDFVSEVYRHKTRERIWVSESARLVRDPKSGRPLYYEGSVREITETVKRLKVEELFRKLTSQLPGALFQFSLDGNGGAAVSYLSPSYEAVTGIPPEAVIAQPELFSTRIHEEDRAVFFDSLAVSKQTLCPWECEYRLVSPEGEERWLRIVAGPEDTGAGTVVWHGYTFDISARKLQQLDVEKLAYYDPLTGLPNRRMLFDRMAKALALSTERKAFGALLYIDLDNFKTLNDSQGHQTGDTYLVQVARRLCESAGPNALVSRIGGDEFVVLLEAVGQDRQQSADVAAALADRILSVLRRDFDLGHIRHRGSASLGLVVFDGSEGSGDDLLKRADIAMYEAKGAGRDGMALFQPEALDRESQRFRLLADLRWAISGDQLDLHFQPQVDRDGIPCGAEALLRWHHPEYGEITPERFPLAEQSGLIHDLDQLVLAKGIRSLAQWQSDPVTARLRLALNISARSLGNADFVPMLERLIAESGIDASFLTLEFTEHVMARDRSDAARRMRDLKTLGIRLSLDNFGSGYSSLAYLRKMPFDELKIDGSFVADIETSESDRTVVRTILAMATTLSLVSVAEHVETEQQRLFLRLFGCNVFQGFLYSPALPLEAFLAYVRGRLPRAPEAADEAALRTA